MTLKNKYNIRLLNQISENIEPDCEDYYLAEIETKAHKYDLIQTQQQEFINYLEDERKRFLSNFNTDGIPIIEVELLDVVLENFKKIMGLKKWKKK